MDGNGLGSYPMLGFDISCVELLCSANRKLVNW